MKIEIENLTQRCLTSSSTVEPTGEKGSAEELKPGPATRSIEAFIAEAPAGVRI